MILKGDIGYLELEVLTNKISGSDDFWEENWLYTSVKGNFPGFTANYDCNLRTDDLKRCYNDVIGLINGITNNAKLTTLEEGIELSFQKDKFGSIQVSGKLTATDLTRCCLEFTFVTDIQTVISFNSQLHKILIEYPIIGKP
ncbi:WapI family immunity protein [Moheibacter stercoris]|uniref:Immunity protein 50 n=1 Tax=Moheibacter stercoris TaxID=1628251 RepID=A0ABV2LV80_9FLAO